VSHDHDYLCVREAFEELLAVLLEQGHALLILVLLDCVEGRKAFLVKVAVSPEEVGVLFLNLKLV
jgi:hypothetical protein